MKFLFILSLGIMILVVYSQRKLISSLEPDQIMNYDQEDIEIIAKAQCNGDSAKIYYWKTIYSSLIQELKAKLDLISLITSDDPNFPSLRLEIADLRLRSQDLYKVISEREESMNTCYENALLALNNPS